MKNISINTIYHSFLELFLPLDSRFPFFLLPTWTTASQSHSWGPSHSFPLMLEALFLKPPLSPICPCSLGDVNQPHSFKYHLCAYDPQIFSSCALSLDLHRQRDSTTFLNVWVSTRHLKCNVLRRNKNKKQTKKPLNFLP